MLSHGYRLWSGLRAKFVLAHLHPHCPAFLFGNRPHCQASQVWTHLSWAIESSFASNIPVGGILADIEKAFNHLPREVVFQTAVAIGLPQPLLVAWSGALGQLVRRFQIREHTGPPLVSCTGFPEGCALSCLGMMLMDVVFHRWYEQSFPLCQPISYVDDLQLVTSSPSQVPALFEHLLTFARLVDLKVDERNTFVWSNSAFHRADFRRRGLRVKGQARGLGAQLQFTRKHSTEVIASRLRELEPLWPKLRSSHSPYRVKVLAVKQAAWTRGLHGVAASSVSNAAFSTLRTNVMRGLAAEGAGCSPNVHLGLVEQPLLDPQCWAIHETLRTVREAASFEALSSLLQETLAPDSSIPTFSMTALLVDRVHSLGWKFAEGDKVVDSIGGFSLLRVSFPELVFRVSSAWTQVVASEVAHRSSFTGLAQSDPVATRRYMSTLSVSDQGLFRKALNGAHFTHDAVCHYSTSGATVCEFCGAQDSRYHRFWDCQVFASDRSHCTHAFWKILPELPQSLVQHGWAMRPSTCQRWFKALENLQVPKVEHSPCPFSQSSRWMDVFSDGSCLWPQSPYLRLAAWAIVQAHPSGDATRSQILMAGPVTGLLQSAFRAELQAIQQALRYAVFWKQNIRLWSDCQSVVDKLSNMLSTKSPCAVNAPHADLWQDIFECLTVLSFGDGVVVTKVAAHQEVDDVTATEHWAFTHNAIVDRAARLANLQRPGEFWELHKVHAGAVEYVTHVNNIVQTTILNISRRVVKREQLSTDCEVDLAHPKHAVPLMSYPAPEWVGFTAKIPVPLETTAKYGHRFVAMVTAWFQQGLEEANGTPALWISLHQLFLDYQFQTGELGPICGKQWTDTATQPRFRLKPHPFKKRSSWFGRSFRKILAAHGCNPPYAVTRPASDLLALHIPSLAIPWPRWRLIILEEWFGRHLPFGQAATRDGIQLKHLPPAKRDGRWPSLCLVSGPIGSWSTRKRADSDSSDSARILESGKWWFFFWGELVHLLKKQFPVATEPKKAPSETHLLQRLLIYQTFPLCSRKNRLWRVLDFRGHLEKIQVGTMDQEMFEPKLRWNVCF